jgi:hypothetical protein
MSDVSRSRKRRESATARDLTFQDPRHTNPKRQRGGRCKSLLRFGKTLADASG